MTITTGAHLSHYRILSPLGAGGMGEIYRALDTQLDREVALKLLPAEFTQDQARVRRFRQEAKAASALKRQAATLCFGLIKNQPWRGGNKRTATYLTDEFLFRNGYEVSVSLLAVIELVLAVEADRFGVDEVEAWYRQRITLINQTP